MGAGEDAGEEERRDRSHGPIYDVLGHDGHRRVLATVLEHGGEMTYAELRVALTRSETERSTARTRNEIKTLLSHLYLPKLEALGLLSSEDDQIRLTLDDDRLPPDVSAFIARDRTAVARCLGVLSVEPRRKIVETVAAVPDGLELAELTGRLLTDGTVDGFDESLARADRLAVTLHHVHLPKLHDAGFVRYDPVRKTVSGTGGDTEDVVTMEDRRRQ